MKDIRQNWKDLAKTKAITKQDIAALCIYRTLRKEESKEQAIERIRKSFIPITNSTKIANGAHPYWALQESMYSLKSSKIYSWLDDEDKEKFLALAKEIKIRGKDIS